jgi:hypothetical protein
VVSVLKIEDGSVLILIIVDACIISATDGLGTDRRGNCGRRWADADVSAVRADGEDRAASRIYVTTL